MAVSGVVCGPGGVDGVTYAVVGGQQVACGSDSAGAQLFLQVSTLGSSGEVPMPGAELAGLQIGAAIFLVLGVAFCFRALRDYINSPGEG